MRKLTILLLLLLPVPALCQETVSSARERVLGYNIVDKFVNFAYITDIHASGKRELDRHVGQCMDDFVSLCNERWCDFAAFGGDMFSAYEATRAEAIELMAIPLSWFSRITIPVFMTKGNHDRNAKLSQEETLTNTQYHMLCEQNLGCADVHFNPEDPYGNYYYVDYAQEKVRVIVLNYFDAAMMQKMGYHDRQLSWLEQSAFGTIGEGWTVVMFSHAYSASDEGFWNLIDAVNASGKCTIAALIHGHTHKDLHATLHGINVVGVAAGFCSGSQLGTPDQDCFSVFTVDTSDRILRETRIGRGENREFRF